MLAVPTTLIRVAATSHGIMTAKVRVGDEFSDRVSINNGLQ